ncbi:MAG: hypothetical protein JJT88_18800 [Gammaproteobacteria bacterium]|nr:hypothetical protein [Gammaproteobacteria bacterium]
MHLVTRTLIIALALATLIATLISLRWVLIDLTAVDAQRVLERALDGRATQAELWAARDSMNNVIEARPHPAYLDRLARIELEAGAQLREADPVAAFASFHRAEELAIAAHAARPGLPHSLLRAAAARAERFQIDDQFEAYLREAQRLGPWDRGVLRTSVLLTLWHWQTASPSLKELVLDRAEEAFAASQAGGLAAVISSANGWSEFCQRPAIREHNPRPCRRVEQAG